MEIARASSRAAHGLGRSTYATSVEIAIAAQLSNIDHGSIRVKPDGLRQPCTLRLRRSPYAVAATFPH
jgi:hypothetical protein